MAKDNKAIQSNLNLVNGRFVSAYLQGFIDAEDNNQNTPGVSGGIWTKI